MLFSLKAVPDQSHFGCEKPGNVNKDCCQVGKCRCSWKYDIHYQRSKQGISISMTRY